MWQLAQGTVFRTMIVYCYTRSPSLTPTRTELRKQWSLYIQYITEVKGHNYLGMLRCSNSFCLNSSLFPSDRVYFRATRQLSEPVAISSGCNLRDHCTNSTTRSLKTHATDSIDETGFVPATRKVNRQAFESERMRVQQEVVFYFFVGNGKNNRRKV